MRHDTLIAVLRDLLGEALERERRFMPGLYRDSSYEARVYRAMDAASTELVALNDPRSRAEGSQ